MEDVAKRHAAIVAGIAEACDRAGRSPSEVRLVGASKRQPIERIRAAVEAGLGILGENIVQEAIAHAEALAETGAIADWHLIGPLQSNKARRAAGLFSTIQSIDRPKIARALDRQAGLLEGRLAGFLEINLGGEPTKHGFSPSGLAGQVRELAELEFLRIDGLMAIPPPAANDDEARAWFRRLRELRDDLFSRSEWAGRPGFLSMGMSGDFEIAIEEGATHVRVGSALFGARG